MNITHNSKTGKTVIQLNWEETRSFLSAQDAVALIRKDLCTVAHLEFEHSAADRPPVSGCNCRRCVHERLAPAKHGLTQAQFDEWNAPPPEKSSAAFVEIGAYENDRYAMEGSFDIRVSPDGFAFLCLGRVSELPTRREESDDDS